VAYSPNGNLIAAGRRDGEIVLVDPSTGKVVRRLLGHRDPTHALTFTPDSKRLFSGGSGFRQTGMVRCWNLADGRVLYTRGFRHTIKGIEFNADESRLLLEGTIDVRILEYPVMTEEALTILHGHTSTITGLKFRADEGHAISSSWDGTIRTWKLPRSIVPSRQ
jgi:WD40 repeat protein